HPALSISSISLTIPIYPTNADAQFLVTGAKGYVSDHESFDYSSSQEYLSALKVKANSSNKFLLLSHMAIGLSISLLKASPGVIMIMNVDAIEHIACPVPESLSNTREDPQTCFTGRFRCARKGLEIWISHLSVAYHFTEILRINVKRIVMTAQSEQSFSRSSSQTFTRK
ncbi:hypothetical protein CVT25_004551, partial [Psilocybe cyanescens]